MNLENKPELIEILSIEDLYYNKKIDWFANLMQKNEQVKDGRHISSYSLKLGDRRSTLHNLNLSVQGDFENNLDLNHLKLLKKSFAQTVEKNIANLPFYYQDDTVKLKQAECLNREEFLDVLKTLPHFSLIEQSLDYDRFFQKIDHDHNGVVSWSDVSNHFLLKLNDLQYTQSIKQLPFNNKPILRHSAHNKMEVTIKFLKMENPHRFINITRRGSVGIWSKNFKLVKTYQITESSERPRTGLHDEPPKKSLWVQDAVLTESNKLCVSTSKRNLRFFNISSENFSEEFSIYALPTNPNCLDYFYDKTTYKSYLFYGDNVGNVNIITFLAPTVSMYDRSYKSTKRVVEISWNYLVLHKEFIDVTTINIFKDDLIKNIKYVDENKSLIVSSGNFSKSVVIVDPELKRKPYVFNLEKPCICFDFEMNSHLLATSCTQSFIEVWDIYSTAKPISKLESPGNKSLSLKIQHPIGYLFSLTDTLQLEVWDLKDDKKIQVIELYFPLHFPIDDYGPYPMSVFATEKENTMLISCKDYFQYLFVGDNFEVASNVPIAHNAPISCMTYSSLFKMVITCCDDSSITFWNLLKGSKFLKVPNAHDKEEISACCLDNAEKTLYTAARDGSIKAWNVANAQIIYTFKQYDDSEINGLVMIDKKRLLISMGASKSIVTHSNIEFDSIAPVQPELLFSGGGHHADDILCCDLHLGLLATGSYDGVINIWSLDLFSLFICLHKKNEFSNDNSPVDKLLFLKSSSYLDKTLLVSSENGYLYFWKIKQDKNQRFIGKFYASSFAEQSVLALDANQDDTLLITGDTKGFLYLWDIAHLSNRSGEIEFSEPRAYKAWRAHDHTITSIKYVYSRLGESNELILTASVDWCCRLWTTNGTYIGSFGQATPWNLNDSSTFHYAVSSDESLAMTITLSLKTKEKKPTRIRKRVNIQAAFKSDDIQENKNETKKFGYLDDLKFLSKMTLEKEERYQPNIIYYEGEKRFPIGQRLRSSGTPFVRLPIHDFEHFPEAIRKENTTLPKI